MSVIKEQRQAYPIGINDPMARNLGYLGSEIQAGQMPSAGFSANAQFAGIPQFDFGSYDYGQIGRNPNIPLQAQAGGVGLGQGTALQQEALLRMYKSQQKLGQQTPQLMPFNMQRDYYN